MSTSNALVGLTKSLEDIDILVRVHSQVTGSGRGRRGREADILNRSGIVLATAAWESYIEEVAGEAFRFLMQKAKSHRALPGALRLKVVEKLQEAKGIDGGKLLNFWALAGDGYKPLARKAFGDLRDRFHTPDCKSCDRFLLQTVGLRGVSRRLPGAKKLDRFIQVRHRVAHGRRQRRVRKSDMKQFRSLLARAGDVVDRLVARAVGQTLRQEERSQALGRGRRRSARRRGGRPALLLPWG